MKAIALVFLVATACANLGNYVWVGDYPVPPPPAEYVVGPGDVIAVRVYGQDGMSTQGKVRTDGKISLPLLNDVDAAGYTTTVLSQQLSTRYKDYVKAANVTVSVVEPRPIVVSMLGEVAHQGPVVLDPNAPGLLQALALAGGLNDFAHKDRIFVIREKPSPARIRFEYDTLTHLGEKASQFRLQGGDVVMVQ